MPNDAYKTSLVEMQNLIDRAGRIEKAIGSRLDQIDKRITDMHVDWNGRAAAAHKDAHQRWLHAARAMHDDLKAMRGQTTRAHEIYTDLVDHNQGMWPKV